MSHTCHWPGCETEVPPAQWGCRPHWYALPKFLRDAIWRHYRARQEISKTPSNNYIMVARLVQRWVEARQAVITDVPGGRGLTRAEVLRVNIAFIDEMQKAGL